jgi:hypothetical protein
MLPQQRRTPEHAGDRISLPVPRRLPQHAAAVSRTGSGRRERVGGEGVQKERDCRERGNEGGRVGGEGGELGEMMVLWKHLILILDEGITRLWP